MNNLTFQKPGSSPCFALRVSLIWSFLVHFALAQTVATPTFLPVSGTSLTKFNVVVTCATANATIRYTVTGADPTVYDPSVVSGGTVTVAQNITLKAKAFSGADSSTTASTTFDLTGDLSAGSQFALAMVTNGQVYGWGNQDFGRLSNNSTATTNVLAPAVAKYSSSSNISNATRIAAGAKHSIMLDNAGSVWGFGNNTLGQAGKTTPGELLYAAKVTSNSGGTTFLTTCTKIAAGLDFSAAVETGGFVATWGNQASGRLGNGSTATGSRKFSGRAKTSSTTDLGGIRDIALGKDFALAREACSLETASALGRLWVWGNNATGNLALGNTTAQSYAIKAKLNATTDLTDVWDADAGDDFTAVVRWKTGDANLQGSVWTFGNRVNSSLGDNGTITGTATYPVQVLKLVGTVYSPLTGIQQISCGPKHTLALDNAGNVWAWGNNATGALGDNTVVTKKYAIKVRNPANTADLTNIARVSAGGIDGSPAFSTAVAEDGTIFVWGSNANGLLANGTTSTTIFATLPVAVAQLKTIPGFPTISLASSVTTALAPGAATLTAAVADPQGAPNIQKTEFFLQGALNTTKTAAPWSVALSALTAGSYHSYAKITDLDGNVSTSLPTTFTINFNPDTDADGLLDTWETTNFGNLAQTATADPDGDGLTNLTEFTNSTNPQDYYNGFVTTLAIATGNSQSIAVSTVTPQALVFTVKNSGGTALTNAPVTLTITAPAANTGTIASTAVGPFTLTTLSLTSNAQGQVSAFYKSPTAVIGAVTLTLSLRNTSVVATTTASVQVINPDSDGDGLLDAWETTHFGNLTQSTTGDPDNDKVTNLSEFTSGTNPNSNADANTDGIPDDWVVWRLSQAGGVAASTLPATGDPDQDELTTLVEYQNNTNPRLLDSDADTQSDWQELAQGTDANDLNSKVSPLAVSAHQGTSNLRIPQTLPNVTPTNSYTLGLSGNFPATTGYELTSSNLGGGPAYEWIDISATGEKLTVFKTDDLAIVQRAIGFAFPFYGTSYSNLYISGQGFATLVPPSNGFPQSFRAPLPNSAGHLALIAPYEQYLDPEILGDVYFKSFPTYTVVQWEQVKVFGYDIRPSFQAVVYSDGSIRFNYKSIPPTAGGSNVIGYLSGVQNATGDTGIGASWYAGAQNGLALHNLDPISLRFAAPTAAAPWVTTTSNVASGNPLSWESIIQAGGLQPGNHQALLELRKSGGLVLYSRPLSLTVLPLGTTGNDTMVGTSGNDAIGGLAGNDIMQGLAGNDSLDGGSGDDTLNGGSGDDALAGSDGKDVYHYALGDGNDTLSDNAGIHQADDATADYSDLYFGVGISPSMLRSRYLDSQAAIKFEVQHASGGSVTITSWNVSSGSTNVPTSRRWRFHFQDGTVWSGQLFWDFPGRPFEGFTGGILNDTVVGSADWESLRGIEGDDLLQGGKGVDKYYYRWGDGRDVIEEIFDVEDINFADLNLDPQFLLAGHLTFEFVPPLHLQINISNPSDTSKNGSVILRNWFKISPLNEKMFWSIYVGDGSGGKVKVVPNADELEQSSGLPSDEDADGLTKLGEYRANTDPTNYDSDGDLLPDGWEVSNQFDPLSAQGDNGGTGDPDADGIINLHEFLLEFDPRSVKTYGSDDFTNDRDGDDMPDRWEVATGSFQQLDPQAPPIFVKKLDWKVADSSDDFDVDGVKNLDEFRLGFDPLSPTTLGIADFTADRDGDFMPDRWEIAYNLDWNVADATTDTDGDTLNNLREFQLQTNPIKKDTDGDALPDNWEDIHGLSPLDPVGSDGASGDPDGDGVTNKFEFVLGLDPQSPVTNGASDFDQFNLDGDGDSISDAIKDSDSDGVPDIFELNVYHTQPLLRDTDIDGLEDGWEISHIGFDPLIPDNYVDEDGDGLRTAEEITAGTNPRLVDTDTDGLEDGLEVLLSLSPLTADSNQNGVLDGGEDFDGDGLSNLSEFNKRTNLTKVDTDGDGVTDASDTDPRGDGYLAY